jgi:hypothetical protein
MGVGKLEREMQRLERYRLYWLKILGEPDDNTKAGLMYRMTGANMNLVNINVKLGENDPEPEQKLEPVSTVIFRGIEVNGQGRTYR